MDGDTEAERELTIEQWLEGFTSGSLAWFGNVHSGLSLDVRHEGMVARWLRETAASVVDIASWGELPRDEYMALIWEAADRAADRDDIDMVLWAYHGLRGWLLLPDEVVMSARGMTWRDVQVRVARRSLAVIAERIIHSLYVSWMSDKRSRRSPGWMDTSSLRLERDRKLGA